MSNDTWPADAAQYVTDQTRFLIERFGPRDSSALEAMVKMGFLGRKTNKGFFLYGKEQPANALAKARKLAANLPIFGDRLSELVGGKGKPLNPGALELFAAHGTRHGSKKVEDKKEEVQDFRDEILNVGEKVLQRLAKIKADKKTAAKKPAATPRKKSIKDS